MSSQLVVPLLELDDRSAGAKALGLSALLREGYAVPRGFVITQAGIAALLDSAHARRRVDEITAAAGALSRGWRIPLVCRSSGGDEDGDAVSAAGRYRTELNVRQVREFLRAARDCATALAEMGSRDRGSLIVQRQLQAVTAGVAAGNAQRALIEASWGQGTVMVSGLVTPDRILGRQAHPGEKGLAALLEPRAGAVWPGDWLPLPGRAARDIKVIRVDPATRLVFGVPADRLRTRLCLRLPQRASLLRLVRILASRRARPVDIEWCYDGRGKLWLLQLRPLTRDLPELTRAPERSADAIVGTPASGGSARGPVHLIRAPSDAVVTGAVLVTGQPTPAMYPHLRAAIAIVTEVGGLLSHAAIVARELGIPAVLGVGENITRLREGEFVTVDGSGGKVTSEGAALPAATPPSLLGPRLERRPAPPCTYTSDEPFWLRTLDIGNVRSRQRHAARTAMAKVAEEK